MIFHLEQISFEYGSREAVRNVSLLLQQGEVAAIVGPNGAGKTTLIKCMASIYTARAGTVLLEGKSVYAYAPKELAKKLGYVPQGGTMSFPLTVLDTVLLGRHPYVTWGVSERDLHVVDRVLTDLNLSGMSDRYVDELSGGERQKVLLARALAQEPKVLLLDEPISALDIRHQLEVLDKVRTLAKRDGTLVIMILHDLELAARYSDHIVLMKNGSVYAAGRPEDVLTQRNVTDVYGVEVHIESSGWGLKITAIGPVETE